MTTPTPSPELVEAKRRKLNERMVRDWNKVFDWLEGKKL